MLFPVHYTKVVDVGSVTSGVTVVIDRGGGFKVFFKPISKCSCCLTYILFITFQPVTFKSIHNATFVGHVVFIFWSQFIFQGLDTFKMNLNAISLANVFDALTLSLHCRGLLCVVLLFLLFCLVFGASIFNFILLMAQSGYLHAVRASVYLFVLLSIVVG